MYSNMYCISTAFWLRKYQLKLMSRPDKPAFFWKVGVQCDSVINLSEVCPNPSSLVFFIIGSNCSTKSNPIEYSFGHSSIQADSNYTTRISMFFWFCHMTWSNKYIKATYPSLWPFTASRLRCIKWILALWFLTHFDTNVHLAKISFIFKITLSYMTLRSHKKNCFISC